MEKFFHPLIVWLHLHPTWAGVVTCFITFFESLAIVGIFIPGSVTLSAIGGLVGSGVVPALEIFIWAIVGAILGDGISYWLGYRYHQSIRKVWPINRFPKLLAKGEAFFAKHGGKSIFIGRFVGPVRPIMPLIAGMLRVPPRKFFTVDIISGILWAPAYMIPGIIVGAAAVHFAPDKAITYVLILLLVIFVLWLLFWVSKLFLRTLIRAWNAMMLKQWLKLKASNNMIYKALYEHGSPALARPLSLLFFVVFFGICFLLLAVAVKLHWQPLLNLNFAISNFFQSVHNAHVIPAAIIISTYLGKSTVVLLSSVLLTIYLVIRRDWNALAYFIAAIVFASGAAFIFKDLIAFVRPQVDIAPPTNFSFPSGHTLMAFVFWGFIAFLVAHRRQAWIKRLAYSIAACVIILVGLSRLYLNVHWFTDVLGSSLLGATILCLIVLFYRCREQQNRYRLWPLIILAICSQLIFGSWYHHKHGPQQNHDFQLKRSIAHIENSTWWYNDTPQLPIYRHNRLGQVSQVFNLQWLASVNEIKRSLQQQGWHQAERFGFKALKSQLTGKDITMLSPLALLYQHQQPVLVMAKPLKNNNVVLLLRLWKSGYLTPVEHLYVGNVSYRLPLKHWLWHQAKDCPTQFTAPVEQLSGDLNDWSIRSMNYTNTQHLTTPVCVNSSDKILKVRGKVY